MMLFAVLDVATGAAIRTCRRRHHATVFPGLFMEVEAAVPEALDVHLVMGNDATHKSEKVRKWLVRRRRWHTYVMPTSAS